MNNELLQLRAVLDNVQACIYTKDRQGRYTYANQQVGQLFNTAPEHILGRDDSAFLAPAHHAQVRANDQQVMTSGEPLTVRETRTLSSSGETHSFLSVKVALRDEQGQVVGLCGISNDITAQEQAESELRAHRELLDTVLDNVEAHIYMKGPDRAYLYVNGKVAQLYGRDVADIIGHTDQELLPPETAAQFRALDDRVFASGQRQAGHELVHDCHGVKHHFWSIKLALERPPLGRCLIGFSSDVTELMQAQAALQRSELRFRTLFEATSEAVLVLQEQRFIDCNNMTLQLFGATDKAAFCRHQPADLSPQRQPCGSLSATLAHEHIATAWRLGRHRFEWIHQRLDNGLLFPAEVTLNTVRLDGEALLLASLRDLTERKRYEAQIQHLAFYDTLTQLPNRSLLHERLSQALVRGVRTHQYGAVIFLDLDNFKPLNDTHGHAAGDLLLQEAARRMKHSLRAQDTVARQGGDEFVVVLLDLGLHPRAAQRAALHVANKVRQVLAQPYVLPLPTGGDNDGTHTVQHHCSASLGLTLFSPTDHSVDAVLKRADDAMYQAKAKGRNQVCLG